MMSSACAIEVYEFFTSQTARQAMTTTLKQALKTHFGFDSFRSKLQEDVVKAVVRGKSANSLIYLLCELISLLFSRAG